MKVNYPKGIKNIHNQVKDNHIISYANRGMDLESEINQSNDYYRKIGKALIYKKPTPIKIGEIDYEKMIITRAYLESPSTTDYNGVYKGKYIDFEAKETMLKNSFPLKNIHKHQIQHILSVEQMNGICFLIVRFVKLNKTFLLLAKDFRIFLEKTKRSSIPLEYFLEHGYIIEDAYLPRVDYLKVIDKILEV